MAGDKHIDVPDEFDALLRKALSLEPSPGFLPRVRVRISEQPHGVYWNWRLWLTGAAAAAVCVVAVVVSTMSDGGSAPPPAPQAPALLIAQPIAAPAGSKIVDPPLPKPAETRSPRFRIALASQPPLDSPVVIVDQRQRTALTAVIRMVSEGRLTEYAFVHTTPPSMQPIRDRVMPIGVTPVEVSPIAVGGVWQSEK